MSKSNGADRGPPLEWLDIEWTPKLKARWQRWVMGADRNQFTAAERVVAFWLADHVNTDPNNEGFGTAWPPTTNGRRQGRRKSSPQAKSRTAGDECHGPNSVNRTETSAQRDRPFWGPTLPR